ncbi:hypothetical protein C8R42DRAFT_641983 [Lentinula raphanica]|nr:hypothetical protein C8R42DRAFT_641983 [Lentinula raphanica]
MTCSTASHALAILILGASISTGVLAAPVHSPMTPSSMGALTGAQGLSSQSSSNGLGQRLLCEGHSPELVRANLVVPRRESELGLTSDDLAMYEPKDGVDPISGSAILDQQVRELSKRTYTQEELEDPKIPPPSLLTKEYLRENEVKFFCWFVELEYRWKKLAAELEHGAPEPSRKSSVKLISDHQQSLDRLHSALHIFEKEYLFYKYFDARVIRLQNKIRFFLGKEDNPQSAPSRSSSPNPEDSPTTLDKSPRLPDISGTLDTPDFSDTPQSLTTPLSPRSADSDSDSDDTTYMSSIRTNASGRVEFGNGKNLGPRVLDRANYDVFDHGDLRRAIEKHAKLTKQTDIKEIWRDAWPASNDSRWFEGLRTKHEEMTMEEFDKSIRSRFIGATWPTAVAEQRGRVRMKNSGAGAFADYVSEVQSLNTELKDTNYFFDDKQLLALLSEGLLKGFREDLIYEKLEISPSTVLDEWVTKVSDFELHSKWRHSGNKPPSYSSNTSSSYEGKNSNVRKNFGGSTSNSRPISMEEITDLAHKSKFKKGFNVGRLTDADKRLLDLIEACYRCRTGWAGHNAADPACQGCVLEVPYRPPTMPMIKKAIEIHRKNNCAITYNALLKAFPENAPSVASVQPVRVMDDISNFIDENDLPPPAPAAAAVNPYGSFPVASVVPDTSLYQQQPLRLYEPPKPVASVVHRSSHWSEDFDDSDAELSREVPRARSQLGHVEPPTATDSGSTRRRQVTRSLSPVPGKRRRSEGMTSSGLELSAKSAPAVGRLASMPPEPSSSAVAAINARVESPEEVDFEGSEQVSQDMPLYIPHLLWDAEIVSANGVQKRTLLIDDGCPRIHLHSPDG